MQRGVEELSQLLAWCQERNYSIHIQPTRFYYSLKEEREIQLTEQGSFQSWM